MTRSRQPCERRLLTGAGCRGNESSVLNITEEQVEQLLQETKLDKGTLLSLAEIFASPPRDEETAPGGHHHLMRPGGKKSSIFGNLKGTLRPRKASSSSSVKSSAAAAGDGQSQPDEEMTLHQFAKLLENANIARGQAAMSMAVLFDTDHSGTISLREFVTSMSVLLKGTPEQKLSFIFDTYDIDGGGTLTIDEVELLSVQMMSAYHSKGISTAGIEAEQVVSHFLKALDADSDGIITREEFVQEGLKNPKLLPLLVSHNWELGEDFMRQQAEKFLHAAKAGKLDRVKALIKDVPVNVLGDSGETALFLAARKHPQVVEFLLSNGADPTLTDFVGASPLHRAAMNGLTDVIDMLLKAGASLDAVNVDGWTAFHVAVMEGHLPVMKHLIQLKADYTAMTRSGLSAVHIAAAADQAGVLPFLVSQYECDLDVNSHAEFEKEFTPLHFACQECNLSALKALLDHQADVDAQDVDGFTPLAILARRTGLDRFPHMEECTKLLLSHHANPTIATYKSNNTPLHVAALANNTVVCHLLAKANRDLMQIKNKEDKTPLQVAQRDAQQVMMKDHMSDMPDHTKMLLEACRQNDQARVVEMTRRGGDPNVQDGAGNSALYFTILNKNVEAAKTLLNAGARLDVQSERGTPLHAAIMTGVVPLVTALLDSGADPKAPDPQWGMLPIHTAAFFGKPLVIRVMVGRKVATIEDASADGKRALHWAAQRGQAESVETLVDMGVFLEAVTNDGLTALHLAAAHGRFPLIKMLLEAGANPDACAPDGRTVLHFAVQEGDAGTISMLMKASPKSILAKTDGGDTVLHRLCMGGTTDAILQFQKYGEELMTSKNDFGQTPLHLACRSCNRSFIETLITLHPDLDLHVLDQDGYSPIYYAAAMRKYDVVKLLKERGAFFREERASGDQIKFEASDCFPKVQCGSLDGLIDYLILTCDKIDDVQFREAFFLSYRQILSPSELLSRLIARYNNAPSDVELRASGFIPSIRESQQAAASVTAASAVDRRRGKKKKVGLKKASIRRGSIGSGDVPQASPPASSSDTDAKATPDVSPALTPERKASGPLDPKHYLLIPENPIRRVLVLRLIRQWISHAYMDFNSIVALRTNMRKSARKKLSAGNMKGSFSSSKNLVKEQSFKVISCNPLLRGNSPDDNMTRLAEFLEKVEPTEEIQKEVAEIDAAIQDITAKNTAKAAEIHQGVAKNKQTSSFLDWTPQESAQQLCIMSKKLWNSLSLWEFYNLAFTKNNKDELSPNINALIRHINRVGDWAKSLILSYDDAKKRGQCIVYLISVMDECIKIRDFSDALGLATALQATSLERLKKSWRYVPEEVSAMLARAKELTDPRGNYKNLRKVVELQPKEPRVPLISLIMGDLIHADEVTGKIDGLHNWYKYELLGRVLGVIPRYQRIEYPFVEMREFASLFNRMEFLDADQVRAVSKKLEPPEN